MPTPMGEGEREGGEGSGLGEGRGVQRNLRKSRSLHRAHVLISRRFSHDDAFTAPAPPPSTRSLSCLLLSLCVQRASHKTLRMFQRAQWAQRMFSRCFFGDSRAFQLLRTALGLNRSSFGVVNERVCNHQVVFASAPSGYISRAESSRAEPA